MISGSVIDISKIVIGERKRKLNMKKAAGMASSISEIGLINPITVTQENGHFRLIGGLHRIEACKILGHNKIEAIIKDFDPLEAELAECDENLHRNDLSHIEQGLHFIWREETLGKLGRRAKQGDNQYTTNGSEKFSPPVTTADIARELEIDARTLQLKKQFAREIVPEVRDTIIGTKLDKIEELKQLIKVEPEEQQRIVEKVLSGKAKDIKEAKRLLLQDEREQAALKAVEENHPLEGKGYKLIHDSIGNYRQHFQPNSIDWIITDPPYAQQYLPLFETLAEFAGYALKPGGSLLVLTGMLFYPKVIAALETGKDIKFYWPCVYLMPGESGRVWHRKINQQHKPILWYVKGEYDGPFVTDVLKSKASDKQHHEWGQSISGMTDIITKFTVENELIVDPFLGGGTTGVVAVQLNRLFVGMDNNEVAILATAKRLASAL